MFVEKVLILVETIREKHEPVNYLIAACDELCVSRAMLGNCLEQLVGVTEVPWFSRKESEYTAPLHHA